MTKQRSTTDKPHLAAEGENPLTHQERVYFEMFRAVELLGRKLEKSEQLREGLTRRLNDIEASATRDDATGKLYLPAKIETATLPGIETTMTRRLTLGAALTGLALGVLALGLVLAQQTPQAGLSARQLAALNNLADGHAPPSLFAVQTKNNAIVPQEKNNALAESGWQKIVEHGAVTADVLTPAPMGGHTKTFQLAAALEAVEDAPDAVEIISSTAMTDDLEDDLYAPDMAQGDTDVDAVEPEDLAEAHNDMDDMGHDDLAALVENENSVDAQRADVQDTAAPVAATQAVVALEAPKEEAPVAPAARTAYQTEPLRDPYLPPSYADLEARAYGGIGEAQHDLAALYAAGGRVRQDYPRAVYWFQRAADAGIANAYYNLGVMAQQGLGMGRDAEKSFDFYSRATRLGHPEAMYNLGLAYIEGRGTKKDNLRGITYFKRAANAGLTLAAYNLGVLYEGGTVEGHADYKSALEWYHVAAVEGHRDAAVAIKRVERLQMQAGALSLADKVEPAAGE